MSSKEEVRKSKMSRWTHVRGSLEVGADPFNQDKSGKKYLPFLEEQLKLKPPEIFQRDNEKANLEYPSVVFSLPKIRKTLEDGISLLPAGEQNLITHSIYQSEDMCSSSQSYFGTTTGERFFKNKIREIYGFDNKDVIPGMVNVVETVLIGIRDDIRHCSGEYFLNSLEKMLKYFIENDIWIEDGYVEWEDEWDEKFMYAWRCSRIDDDPRRIFAFYKLNKKTNKIVWSKTYLRSLKNEDGVFSDKDFEIKEWRKK